MECPPVNLKSLGPESSKNLKIIVMERGLNVFVTMETLDFLMTPIFKFFIILKNFLSKKHFIPCSDGGLYLTFSSMLVCFLPRGFGFDCSLPGTCSGLPVKRVHGCVGFVVAEDPPERDDKLISIKIVKVEPIEIIHHDFTVSIPVSSES